MRIFGRKISPANLRLGIAVLATFGAATMFSREFFETPPTPDAQRRPAAEGSAVHAVAATAFHVGAVEGPVEAFHKGQWYAVQAGDRLDLQDVIRTPKGAKALLRRSGVEIEVREDVDIRLDSLAAQAATFGVLRGNVVASVSGAGQGLEITALHTRSQSRGEARWVVSVGPDKRVSVAASKGEVAFSGKGKEVTLREGTESTAPADQPPQEPEAIPEDLLLSVIWPERDPAAPATQIAGKVRPSSRVRVNGVETPTAEDGSFTVPVDLRVGANRVEIEARDISGQKKAVSRVIDRAARAPALETSGEDLWKK